MNNEKWLKEQKFFDITIEGYNDFTKTAVGNDAIKEASYVYEIDPETENYTLIKKPDEDSKLPESTTFIGLLHMLSVHNEKILVIRDNKVFYRFNYKEV